jgi:uncharacterized protein YdaU (DUF1376 family)
MEHIDLCVRRWIDGTRCLSNEQRGVYIDLVCLMYDLGGPIDENHRWLAGACALSTRKFARILQSLVDLKKIRRFSDGNRQLIIANRVEIELKRANDRVETARKNGKLRGRNSENQTLGEPSRLTDSSTPRFDKTEPTAQLPLRQDINPLPLESEPGTHPISAALAGLTASRADGALDPCVAQPVPAEPACEPVENEPPPKPPARVNGECPRLTPRQLGTNPRALGSNPRAQPRAQPHAPVALPPAKPPTGPPEVVARFEPLRAEIGDFAWRAWITPLAVVGDNGVVRIRAPSVFHASHVQAEYRHRLEALVERPVEIAAGEIAAGGDP